MAKEYIAREAVLKVLDEKFREKSRVFNYTAQGAILYCAYVVEKAPAADVKEVVRGEWNKINRETTGLPWEWRCNQCGCPQDYNHNFCPNCGADMRGHKE